MSEHFFAVRRTELPGGKREARRRDRIARSIGGSGCGYVYYYDPAERGWRGWGYIPNRGQPFDRSLASEIEAAWNTAR